MLYGDELTKTPSPSPNRVGAGISRGAGVERSVGSLDEMRDALVGLIELRSRLERLNIALHGACTEGVAPASATPKPESVADIVRAIHAELRGCHNEVNTAYNSLGV